MSLGKGGGYDWRLPQIVTALFILPTGAGETPKCCSVTGWQAITTCRKWAQSPSHWALYAWLGVWAAIRQQETSRQAAGHTGLVCFKLCTHGHTGIFEENVQQRARQSQREAVVQCLKGYNAFSIGIMSGQSLKRMPIQRVLSAQMWVMFKINIRLYENERSNRRYEGRARRTDNEHCCSVTLQKHQSWQVQGHRTSHCLCLRCNNLDTVREGAEYFLAQAGTKVGT